MSDSDQLSAGGSSLSLFSGLGTSSISGASETGLVNVEELSDSKLESLLEEQKAILRLLELETFMFESFHDRLSSGQISLTPTSHSSSQSRKGSGTFSDTISESDSQPPTTGTSLLDVSHKSHLSNRKRSSSRTSLGSRGKSLRLSEEQKCGIANKEMERIAMELTKFRKSSRKESSNGIAEISERAMRLEELLQSKGQLTKRLSSAKIAKTKNYNYQKLEESFRRETSWQRRHMQKLATKNGVLSSQIKRLAARIHLDSTSEQESGPVDMEQLQLENDNHCAELDLRNAEVISLRRTLTDAKSKRRRFKEMMKFEEAKRAGLEKNLNEVEASISELKDSLPKVEVKIDKQIESTKKLKEIALNYKAPSVDAYISLKLQEMKLLEDQKLIARKVYLDALTQSVRRQRAKSAHARMVKDKEGKRVHDLHDLKPQVMQGRLIRGKTFNIEFKTIEK